jgi:hypothetical protein
MPPTCWQRTCNPLAGHAPPPGTAVLSPVTRRSGSPDYTTHNVTTVPPTTFVLLPVSLGESEKDAIVVDVFFVPVETSNQEAHGPVIVRP